METKKAIIYARVSTMGQDYTRQVSDLQTYANGNGYKVVSVFTEKISGAKKNSERLALVDALECALSSGYTILCSELSRLGRNTWEVQENVKRCVDAHTDIFFQKERLHLFNEDNTLNPFANIMISVLGTCAELERDAIRFRMRSGYEHYIDNGGKVGRKEGYRKGIKQYECDYPQLVEDLRKKIEKNLRGDKYSVRYLAKEHNVNESTVQAIARLLKA